MAHFLSLMFACAINAVTFFVQSFYFCSVLFGSNPVIVCFSYKSYSFLQNCLQFDYNYIQQELIADMIF